MDRPTSDRFAPSDPADTGTAADDDNESPIGSPPPLPLPRALPRRLRAWAGTRVPELVLVTFGVLLRFSLSRWYDVKLGYDYPTHHQYVRYIVEHHALPPFDLNVATYHPPLYYALAALVEGLTGSAQAVAWLAIVSSCLQLLLLWWGFELYLPRLRLARIFALATATVVPAAVHVAGMVSNEALSDLFCTAAVVLLPQIFLRRGRALLTYAIAAGAFLGLALMTKISGAMVVVAFVFTVATDIVRNRGRRPITPLLKAATTVLLVAAVVGGWPYARLRLLHGQWIFTGYDQWAAKDTMQRIPYLDRRTLGFFLYWNGAMYAQPYWPSASSPYARFWPMLVTTTFSDYYNFAYAPRPAPKEPAVHMNGKPLRRSAVVMSCLSVVGGTALAWLAAFAWLVGTRALWRGRDYGRLLILVVALTATLGQLHFAVAHPYDGFGPIKGAYLQFAGPIYCALSGLALAAFWSRRHPAARLLGWLGVAAVALVAAYTLFARLLLPLGL